MALLYRIGHPEHRKENNLNWGVNETTQEKAFLPTELRFGYVWNVSLIYRIDYGHFEEM